MAAQFLNFPYTGCPGNTPGTVFPFFTTKVPFTRTYSMPVENSSPFSNVALSATVLGLKIVMSASAPTCILPLYRIIGEMPSSRRAGSSVIFSIASGSVSTLSYLTNLPNTLEKVPAVLGCASFAYDIPSDAIMTPGETIPVLIHSGFIICMMTTPPCFL